MDELLLFDLAESDDVSLYGLPTCVDSGETSVCNVVLMPFRRL